jgi:hypothetical protein
VSADFLLNLIAYNPVHTPKLVFEGRIVALLPMPSNRARGRNAKQPYYTGQVSDNVCWTTWPGRARRGRIVTVQVRNPDGGWLLLAAVPPVPTQEPEELKLWRSSERLSWQRAEAAGKAGEGGVSAGQAELIGEVLSATANRPPSPRS